MRPRHLAAAAVLAVAAAACGGGEGARIPRAAVADSLTSAPSASPGKVAKPATDAAIAVHAAAGDEPGHWVLTGTTSITEGLEVSVEDGQSVVYGPEAVQVKDGAFRVDVALPDVPSGASLLAFVGDAGGRHQAVVGLH